MRCSALLHLLSDTLDRPHHVATLLGAIGEASEGDEDDALGGHCFESAERMTHRPRRSPAALELTRRPVAHRPFAVAAERGARHLIEQAFEPIEIRLARSAFGNGQRIAARGVRVERRDGALERLVPLSGTERERGRDREEPGRVRAAPPAPALDQPLDRKRFVRERDEIARKVREAVLGVERHGALPRAQRTGAIAPEVEERGAELAPGACRSLAVRFGKRAQSLGAGFEQGNFAVGGARRQRVVHERDHVRRVRTFAERAGHGARGTVGVPCRAPPVRQIEQHARTFAAERTGGEPALHRGDAESPLARFVRDLEHGFAQAIVSRTEHVERAPRESARSPWSELEQTFERRGDARRERSQRLRLRKKPGERVGETRAVLASHGSFEPGPRRVEIAGPERREALSPRRREQRLAERVVRRGECATQRRPRHDDAHRPFHRFGAPAVPEQKADLGTRRGWPSEGGIGVARELRRAPWPLERRRPRAAPRRRPP